MNATADDKAGQVTMPQKILIIKLSALGDVAAALPYINAIATFHHNDEVWLMTSPMAAEITANMPGLFRIFLNDKKWFRPEGRTGRRRWVKKQRFDRVYDLQGNRTGRMLVKSSRAAVRVGLQPNRCYTHTPPQPIGSDPAEHFADRLDALLNSAGVPGGSAHRCLYPTALDVDSVARWKKDNRLTDGAYVVLHAGCSPEWPSKQWPKEHFKALASMIETAGYRCIWVGADPDRDLNAWLSARTGLDATGQFNLPQLYELARNARLAVSNDSCPMHIFALAGIPLFSFFGATNWRWSGPRGQKDRIMKQALPCSPCFLKQCPRDRGHACMTEILPEKVMEHMRKELPRPEGQHGRASQ